MRNASVSATASDWFDEPYLAGLLRDTEPSEVIERVRASFTSRDTVTAARNRANYTILEHSLAKLSAAGVAIILGCDTGLEDHFFGYAEQKELELIVKAGMTPAQANGVVNRLVDVQAYTLAVDDLFLLSAAIFLLLVLMLWMTRPQRGVAADAAGAH